MLAKILPKKRQKRIQGPWRHFKYAKTHVLGPLIALKRTIIQAESNEYGVLFLDVKQVYQDDDQPVGLEDLMGKEKLSNPYNSLGDFTYPALDVTPKDFETIFCRPHDVITTVKNAMFAIVVLHGHPFKVKKVR